MKLKTRLVAAFLIIVLIPVVLSIGLTLVVGRYQLNSIEEKYEIQGATVENISNTMQVMSRLTENAYAELQKLAKTDPAKLEDLEFLSKYNKDLTPKHAFLIVRKADNILFLGASSEAAAPALSHLPEAASLGEVSEGESSIYYGGEDQVLIKQVNFITADEQPATVFLVSDVKEGLPEARDFFVDIVFGIVLILVITAGLLSFWIYRSVITPLGKMKKAAQNIEAGNLDFVLEPMVDDEIGALGKDLEDMRLRLKDSAAEKVKYDQESKELISNISHDLKTPVTAIKGYAEGIMDGVADTPEKMDKYIRTIYNKANEMNLLINELTLYSKIDTNRIPYNFSTLSATEYFGDCAEDLSFELEAKNVQFEYHNYVGEEVMIIADAEQIRRVIHNIINNSIKYMGKDQPKINLRVNDVGDFVQVEIEDNGRGIAAADLPNIFERFYRTDTSRNSTKGGSGIGLSIVKKIIEEHGGKIWATSKEETGTTMYFVLRKYQEVPN
ncbi:sensor histidine kinase [Ohessyouella blattaphilus]|uniref:histidine kinase n=1 Tax=Ohessyouella blattaphilus TaxID=2949333 RepID=A0ABT1EL35_9FIRM|nr:HAMP domain-containing sensor histidine kinase [Ohessyouella blattaphilus]MCP1111415.1 HAMP domain-containing histidine kinase [Ohessyouella blattaphilus]MCR8564809.1 HAMP domain-containing histidine kinase [Ohessyouella blattaphilus]